MAGSVPAKPPLATPHLTEFITRVAAAKAPAEVLDFLQVLATRVLPPSDLGAARIPLQMSDRRSTRLV